MPRANRYIVRGHIYHLTHRCHDRSFLFQFAKHRNDYRRRLIEAKKKHAVSILDYCITSNHVHLIVYADDERQIAVFIQQAAGEFAREYNRQKKRSGAFWEGRYQVTMVEGGQYLQRCLEYVEINMVRCGMVQHPGQWEWNGYAELMGLKERNRLLDVPKLLELLGGVGILDFRKNFEHNLTDRILRDQLKREALWTEHLAVGSRSFIKQMSGEIRNRQQLEMDSDGSGLWSLKETDEYGAVFGAKK